MRKLVTDTWSESIFKKGYDSFCKHHLLGMMETVLRARRTLKVLRPARLPISMKEVR